MEKKNRLLDAIHGCLLGGAIGDALGYPVEFWEVENIFNHYGPEGIREYTLTDNIAQISDDTQMTLFTAAGLMAASRDEATNTIIYSVWEAYRDWYLMQMNIDNQNKHSKLCNIRELGEFRAPGNTCMFVLGSGHPGSMRFPINNSKGCGGIMRVAPVGIYFNNTPWIVDQIAKLDLFAAETAALTHGHELGYIPAAILAHIINRIIYGGCSIGNDMKSIVIESITYAKRIFPATMYMNQACQLLQKAIMFAQNEEDDLDNIRLLGKGWVAEETLAIAVYCSLKYLDDFSEAICAAVNHDGDSDSTGAVTGNIIGAWYGYEMIPKKWKDKLECSAEISSIAHNLHGNIMKHWHKSQG